MRWGNLLQWDFWTGKTKHGYFIPLPTHEDAEQVDMVRENIESQFAMSAVLHASDKEIREFLKQQVS
ncbi:MAG: hypothetical protein J7K09_06680 [Desulfuromusa sp.]|nr:hypothetical protein [Desulfuromusa sp.]